MADHYTTVEVPRRWLLGEPTKVEESMAYQDDPEFIPSILEHFNAPEGVVEFIQYHGWLDVLVVRDKVSKYFLGGYLLIERDEYFAKTEDDVEQMVATALVRFAVCNFEY